MCYDRWRFALSFRITSKASAAAAAKQIQDEKVTFVADMLYGSEFNKILKTRKSSPKAILPTNSFKT